MKVKVAKVIQSNSLQKRSARLEKGPSTYKGKI